MKKAALALFLISSFAVHAQNAQYTVASYKEKGTKAPNTHYLGEAWLNGLLPADGEVTYNMTKATFRANSTLDWHWHETPQVLIVVEGEGYYQEKGKDPIRMKEGDVIKCDRGTEHWHASSIESDVTYLALYGGTQPTTWTEVLSLEYYEEVAEKLKKD